MATTLPTDFQVSKETIAHVPVLLSTSNYQQWVISLRSPLQMLGGWNIVNGDITEAAQTTADNKAKWKAIDAKILDFLSTGVSLELQTQVI
jgi:hypothetical protein